MESDKVIRKAGDITLDRIYRYYFDRKANIFLNSDEQKVLERLDFAWTCLLDMKTKKETSDLIQSKFEVGRSIAYNDVRNAEMLFPDARHKNKEAKRAQSDAWTLWALNKAKESENLDVFNKLLDRYNDIHDLKNHEENNIADLVNKLKPTTINIISDPASLKAMAEKMRGELEAIDIEHKEAE